MQRTLGPAAITVFFAHLSCSFLLDFQPCESDEHCPDGRVCADDGECVPLGSNKVLVSGTIESDTIWDPENTYVLEETVFVESGVTLTVRAGTKVLGEEGSALVVMRGGRLEARGTEFAPIVFTSAKEEGLRTAGDWGGVALLGRAQVNEQNAAIEGIADQARGGYGGDDDEWSCGVLEYTRIEFAGFPLVLDEELNGLTLGGCGSGTIVDHVQVHFGKDDGVEIFGGTVDLRHVVITRAQDDSLDWDRGWRGRAQFVAIAQDENGDNGIEADNWADENDADPRSRPNLFNVTLFGSGGAGDQRGATFKEGTAGLLANALFVGQPTEGIDVKQAATTVQLELDELRVRNSLFFAVGPGGEHWFPTLEDETELEPDDGRDDDEGFDEAAHFSDEIFENVFGVDPILMAPFDPSNPGWVPVETDLVQLGLAPPPGFDESATWVGAFAPDTTAWTEGWTSYPAN